MATIVYKAYVMRLGDSLTFPVPIPHTKFPLHLRTDDGDGVLINLVDL